MKKALILAMAATLLLTGALFADGRRLVAQPNATFTPGTIPAGGTIAAASGPTTTNNDDSCDIGTAPAATLLLPYFAVNATSLNTIFTVINTSTIPQVAHVTVWTDWSFPVLDFNIYLTGYDVQAISLRDVILNGVIAPVAGATNGGGTTDNGSTTSGTGLSPVGALSTLGNANFTFTRGAATSPCRNQVGNYGPTLAAAVASALTNGTYVIPGVVGSCTAADQVGTAAGTGTHPAGTAIGYVTVDVAATCSLRLPTDAAYFRSEILFDNVLTGDFEIFDSSAASNYAGGNPLVHIRAVPEGGPANAAIPAAAVTNLPYTFYGRYIDGTVGVPITFDRRQPLPSTFAARYIQGGTLSTSYRVWREGVTGGSNSPVPTSCLTASDNSALTIAEVVRFDEHENPSVYVGGGSVSPSTPAGVTLPETSNTPVTSTTFPNHTTVAGDVGGWMYLNLALTGAQAAALSPANTALYGAAVYNPRPSQNWVVVAMSGSGPSAGAYSVDFDAAWLGNGCSGIAPQSTANGGVVPLGPRPNTTP